MQRMLGSFKDEANPAVAEHGFKEFVLEGEIILRAF